MKCRRATAVAGLMAGAVLMATGGCMDEIQDRQPHALDAQACSTVGQNRQILNVMRDWYLYVDWMSEVNPRQPSSTQQMLNALLAAPPDEPPDEDEFTFLRDREQDEAFRQRGEQVGLGFSAQLFTDTDGRIVQAIVREVFPDTPADAAGIERGNEIRQVAGEPVEGLFQAEFVELLGPNESGVEVSLEIVADETGPETLEVTKETIQINPVGELEVFDLEDGDRRVGYLLFRSFIQPAADGLDEAFAELRDAGVDDLILDLRYNGGGQLNIARQLAGMIGGGELEGELFVGLRHNDARAPANDRDQLFEDEPGAMDLDNLVVIGTRNTASASEMVFNSLKPFTASQVDGTEDRPIVLDDIQLVGSNTRGKPVGSYGFDICDQRLFPIAFRTVNADEQGNFFGGFSPGSCAADDELSRALGDPEEASLAQALTFLGEGSCDEAEAPLPRAPWHGPVSPADPRPQDLEFGGIY